MSAILPGPMIEFEVALAVGQAANAGVWESGVWDANSWGETDTSLGDWVDVSCYVINSGVHLTAGATSADGVVTRWEAATTNFELLGAQFDPRSGPYAGLLSPGLPVRIRWRPNVVGAEWLTAFGGFVDDDGFSYSAKGHPTASVAATDGTRIFAGFDGLEQPIQGTGETAAERVTRIADMVGWPENLRDIEAGGVTVQGTTLAQNSWTLLLQVADTDLALLWVNRAGELAYRPQGKVKPSHAISAYIACGPASEMPDAAVQITPLDILGQQPTVTRNMVSISRQSVDGVEAATATLIDEGSVARFMAHPYARTDLIHTDDAWNERVAQAVLDYGAWPSTAPELVELDSRADLAATAVLLALEPSLSIMVGDGINAWECEPAGWDVTVYRTHVAGEVHLLDVSQWFGSVWDAAIWDDTESRWGF